MKLVPLLIFQLSSQHIGPKYDTQLDHLPSKDKEMFTSQYVIEELFKGNFKIFSKANNTYF